MDNLVENTTFRIFDTVVTLFLFFDRFLQVAVFAQRLQIGDIIGPARRQWTNVVNFQSGMFERGAYNGGQLKNAAHTEYVFHKIKEWHEERDISDPILETGKIMSQRLENLWTGLSRGDKTLTPEVVVLLHRKTVLLRQRIEWAERRIETLQHDAVEYACVDDRFTQRVLEDVQKARTTDGRSKTTAGGSDPRNDRSRTSGGRDERGDEHGPRHGPRTSDAVDNAARGLARMSVEDEARSRRLASRSADPDGETQRERGQSHRKSFLPSQTTVPAAPIERAWFEGTEDGEIAEPHAKIRTLATATLVSGGIVMFVLENLRVVQHVKKWVTAAQTLDGYQSIKTIRMWIHVKVWNQLERLTRIHPETWGGRGIVETWTVEDLLRILEQTIVEPRDDRYATDMKSLWDGTTCHFTASEIAGHVLDDTLAPMYDKIWYYSPAIREAERLPETWKALYQIILTILEKGVYFAKKQDTKSDQSRVWSTAETRKEAVEEIRQQISAKKITTCEEILDEFNRLVVQRFELFQANRGPYNELSRAEIATQPQRSSSERPINGRQQAEKKQRTDDLLPEPACTHCGKWHRGLCWLIERAAKQQGSTGPSLSQKLNTARQAGNGQKGPQGGAQSRQVQKGSDKKPSHYTAPKGATGADRSVAGLRALILGNPEIRQAMLKADPSTMDADSKKQLKKLKQEMRKGGN